jgi:hypothetical protein
MGGAAASVLFGPVDCDERRERLCRFVVVDTCAAVVCIDERRVKIACLRTLCARSLASR